MSEIRAGDLVMVVRARSCCGKPTDIGHIYQCSGLYHILHCTLCGENYNGPVALINGEWHAKEIRQLIKIDPPAIPESIETREELHA